MSQDSISALEKLACKFIEELRNISIEINILHKSEIKKANTLIYCVKSAMDNVGKEVEKNKKKFKRDN